MQTLDKFCDSSFTFVTLAEAVNDEKINAALKARGIQIVPTEAGKQLANIIHPEEQELNSTQTK